MNDWLPIQSCPTNEAEVELRLPDGSICDGFFSQTQGRWMRVLATEVVDAIRDQGARGIRRTITNLSQGEYPSAWRPKGDLVERLQKMAATPTSRRSNDEIDMLLRAAAAHISRTSGSAGREMPTREEIAQVIADARMRYTDDFGAGKSPALFPEFIADAVLALFPAPGKETT